MPDDLGGVSTEPSSNTLAGAATAAAGRLEAAHGQAAPESRGEPTHADSAAAPAAPSPASPSPAAVADLFEFDYGGRKESLSRRDTEDLVRWALDTLSHAHQEAGRTRAQPQPQAHQPQAMGGMEDLRRELRELQSWRMQSETERQSAAILDEVTQALGTNPLFGKVKPESSSVLKGAIAAIMGTDTRLSAKDAAGKFGAIVNELVEAAKADFLQGKLEQAGRGAPPAGGSAPAPGGKKHSKADIWNGGLAKSAMNRLLKV